MQHRVTDASADGTGTGVPVADGDLDGVCERSAAAFGTARMPLLPHAAPAYLPGVTRVPPASTRATTCGTSSCLMPTVNLYLPAFARATAAPSAPSSPPATAMHVPLPAPCLRERRDGLDKVPSLPTHTGGHAHLPTTLHFISYYHTLPYMPPHYCRAPPAALTTFFHLLPRHVALPTATTCLHLLCRDTLPFLRLLVVPLLPAARTG